MSNNMSKYTSSSIQLNWFLVPCNKDDADFYFATWNNKKEDFPLMLIMKTMRQRISISLNNSIIVLLKYFFSLLLPINKIKSKFDVTYNSPVIPKNSDRIRNRLHRLRSKANAQTDTSSTNVANFAYKWMWERYQLCLLWINQCRFICFCGFSFESKCTHDKRTDIF